MFVTWRKRHAVSSTIRGCFSETSAGCTWCTTLFGTPPGDEPGTIALGNVELHLQASADREPGLKDLVLETEKGATGVHELGFLTLETRAARDV